MWSRKIGKLRLQGNRHIAKITEIRSGVGGSLPEIWATFFFCSLAAVSHEEKMGNSTLRIVR